MEAEAIGLVTRLVDDDALEAEGLALATRLADAPTAAYGAARAWPGLGMLLGVPAPVAKGGRRPAIC